MCTDVICCNQVLTCRHHPKACNKHQNMFITTRFIYCPHIFSRQQPRNRHGDHAGPECTQSDDLLFWLSILNGCVVGPTFTNCEGRIGPLHMHSAGPGKRTGLRRTINAPQDPSPEVFRRQKRPGQCMDFFLHESTVNPSMTQQSCTCTMSHVWHQPKTIIEPFNLTTWMTYSN